MSDDRGPNALGFPFKPRQELLGRPAFLASGRDRHDPVLAIAVRRIVGPGVDADDLSAVIESRHFLGDDLPAASMPPGARRSLDGDALGAGRDLAGIDFLEESPDRDGSRSLG
jgi:hypothetical protein